MIMSDALNVFGIEYVGVAGIKASGTDGNIKTYIRPQGTKSISANGTGIDVSAYAAVDVAVPSGTPTLQSKTKSYTPTETAQTESVTADSGYDGLDTVSISVAAIPSNYVGSGVTRRDSTDLSASGATVSVPSGYYENNASKTIPNASLGVKSVSKTKADGKFTTKFSWNDATDGYFNQVLINSLNYAAQDSLVLENKTVTPTTSQQVVTPTIPADNYLESVTVLAMPSGSLVAEISGADEEPSISVSNTGLISVQGGYSGTVHPISTSGFIDSSATTELEIAISGTSQLSTQSATTITPSSTVQTAVAAGKYTTGAVTVAAVPSGTAGTPTATKGAVSNHSVSVTPSVTNTTGYITGSTMTGTAVTVTASELVSGSETKTENGTYDVTNLAEIVVDVSGGGSTGAQVDVVSTTPSAAVGYIQFEDLKGEPTSLAVIARGDIATASSEKVAAVVWDGSIPIALFGQKITNTSNAQVSYTNGAFSASYSSGVLTIYASGVDFQPIQYDLVYSYSGSASAIGTTDVQVGSGATSITFTGLEDEPIYWSCVFKSNFSTSSGYQRVIAVVYDGTDTYGLEMDSGAHAATHWTSSYSNGSLTITSNGTNQGGYFHQPGYYQLTYAVGDPSPYQKKSVTYTPTTSQQTATITADTGYDALSQVSVTVNAMPTMTLPSSASATSSGTSKATITPGSSVQYLNIPTGYNGTAQYYTIGASGGGGGSLTVATKTLTLTAVSRTLSFTSLSGQPKYWFVRCTSNVSSSGSTTYYYVTDAFYDGTSVKGNTFRIGSTRRVQNITSGITQSYSGGTLTITAGSSSGATPGQFYGASGIGYELVYIY